MTLPRSYPFKARMTSVRILARAEVRTALRRPTSRWRALPDLLIIGAQRGGTTSLFTYLAKHPDVARPISKEIEYFTSNYRRGQSWYRSHFPVRPTRGDRPLAFEASPSYLFDPRAAERAHALLPRARIVAILRNPVRRAFSHYQLMVAMGFEGLTFEQALERESDRLDGEFERMRRDAYYKSRPHRRHSYLGHGRYAEQLERWLQHYPRDQVLILSSEDLYNATPQTYSRVLQFVGLPDLPIDLDAKSHPLSKAARSAELKDDTAHRLYEYFAPHNQRLYDLVGRDLGW